MATAVALKAKIKTARAGLAKCGAGTLGGRTFVPVIIAGSRFCPFTAAYVTMVKTCNVIAAINAFQMIMCDAAIAFAIEAGVISVNGPTSAISLAT